MCPGGARRNPKSRSNGANFWIRPNLKRGLLLAIVMVTAVFVGYYINDRFREPVPPESGRVGPPPDTQGRAYERPLPRKIDTPTTKAQLKSAPAVTAERESSPSRAPAPKIFLKTQQSPLPWRQYAVAPPDIGKRPMIAIIIDDMGIDRKRSAKAAELRPPLTLSFLTYADDLDDQAERARRRGHELMLHVPMEPGSDKVDPGPNVLMSRLSPSELDRRLQWSLGRLKGYVGINNHMGSLFTTSRAGMTMVMWELKRRGLLFLDSRTTNGTVGSSLALALGVPFAERDIFLDNVNSVADINDRLSDLESLARRQGYAIAIGHPRDATIEALSNWIPGVYERGFVLVPLTTIISRLEKTG